MKKIILLFAFFLAAQLSYAQFFQASFAAEGNSLVFKLRPNPGGGDITTSWSDIEFFVRWPEGASAFKFGAIAVNHADFPGIAITNNGFDKQGSEKGYVNAWFGTSFFPTPKKAYADGVEYEVFRVSLNVAPDKIDFELVHNTFLKPHYLALVCDGGTDLTNPSGNFFYGHKPIICSIANCPASTPGANHVLRLNNALPVKNLSFQAGNSETEIFLEIFPNPAGEKLQIVLSEPVPGGDIRLYNQLGQLAFQQALGENEQDIQLQVGHLPKGAYWLELHSEKRFWREKIVMQ